MERVSCNICGSSSTKLRYRLSDWHLDRPEVQTELVECQECGLLYQNPRLSISEMAAHYPADYEPYHDRPLHQRPWLLRKMVEYGLNVRAKAVLQIAGKPGRVLDVGCATGEFLHYMHERYGWQVHGVEPSRHASKFAQEKYGLNVFCGVLEDANFPASSFDVVTLWDVLEHLHDPGAALCEIHRILRPGGHIIFRVPNGGSYDARLFGQAWAGLDAPRHLYVFDRTTIHKLLRKASFDVTGVVCRAGSYTGFLQSIRFWMVANQLPIATRRRVATLLNHPLARAVSSPFFFLYSMTNNAAQMMVTARAVNGRKERTND